MEDFKVVMMPIGKIKPYQNNPRHNENAIDPVAASIHEFGFMQPIVVDKNMVIIAGHTRYKAALQMGMDEVPVKIAEELTEQKADEYRLADNKTGEMSGWNTKKLLEQLQDLDDYDMTQFGFNQQYVENQLNQKADEILKKDEKAKTQYVICPRCGRMILKGGDGFDESSDDEFI